MSDNGLTWTNEQRRLGDLLDWPQNPRQIRKDEAGRLADSLDKFGQVQTIAIDPDNEIVDGHQRKNVWGALARYGPDFLVDVRVASRHLTERERQQLAVYLHKGAAGEWDFDTLANWDVEIEDLTDWGFSLGELGLAGMYVPDFQPVDESEQPRLDQKKPVTCPECGHEFTPKG